MTGQEVEQMKIFADQLWGYFKPKIKDMMRTNVKFFRAKVVSNPGDGTLVVQKPFDSTTLTLPCTQTMESAQANSQVIVFVLGNLSNAVVVSDGKFSSL